MRLSEQLLEILDEKKNEIKVHEDIIFRSKERIRIYEKEIERLSKQCLDLADLIQKQSKVEGNYDNTIRTI